VHGHLSALGAGFVIIPRRVIGLALAGVVVACTGPASSPPATGPIASPSPSPATAVPVPASSPAAAPPTDVSVPSAALLGSPPIARLAVEGGDPIEGQLGTYTWGGGGSDAPWLPGAPIEVASGEPLEVTFEPLIGVTAWRGRIVPAAATGPAGATVLAEGSGPPRFEAPSAGAWTLEVQVTFPAGMGAASYAWALTVS
jgi:hypothetical protein